MKYLILCLVTRYRPKSFYWIQNFPFKYFYLDFLLFLLLYITLIPRYNNILSWLPISLVKDKKRMRRHVVTGYIPTLTDLTLESQLSLFYFMGKWNIEGSFIYTNHLQSSSECTLQQMEVLNILVPLKLAWK